jgi:maleate isomerase
MSGFPYSFIREEGPAPLGLIVLQVDETIESDFRRFFPAPSRAIHVSRIPSGAELTVDTIGRMEADLPRAASLLPQVPRFAAVGYGCTSGTTLIGAARVAALVAGGCRTRAVCDPLTAALAACGRLGLRSLAVVSPYTADIARPVCAAFEAGGIVVPRALHFGEEIEANVARIAPRSLCEAARAAVGDSGAEGLFLSCTNLKTLDVIGPLEQELGVPVFGSNLALGWMMAEAAGMRCTVPGGTRLLELRT